MNMDYMSQFMGPGLGGIMAGTEQRQIEDKRAADTQMTLQQIMASQGQEQRAGAAEARNAELHPIAVERGQLANKEAVQKITREEGKAALEEFARIVGTPGWEETMQQEHPKFVKNPLFKAGIEAHKRDSAGFGPGERPEGPTNMEQLLERVGRTPASIEQRQREEALARKAALKAAADQLKVETQQAGMDRRNRATLEARQAMAEAENAARAAKIPNEKQALGRVMVRLQDAIDGGDPEEIKAARDHVRQATNTLMEIATAVNTEKGQNATARARALGIDVPDYIPRAATPTPGAAPAPAATPAPAGPRTSPSGRGVTIGPVSQAPAPQGPGPVAQALDGAAAAILPSAQAAEMSQAQAAQQPMWAEPPPPQVPPGAMPNAQPVAGMAQPQPGPMPVRAPGNPRLGRSPDDFPRVQPQEQRAMDVQALQQKAAELKQFMALMPQLQNDPIKGPQLNKAIGLLSKEILEMKQKLGL